MFLTVTTAHHLVIENLHNNPLLLIKERECKIQVGTIKIIHPINMTVIENTIETLTSASHRKLESTNPLTNIIKFKIQQLYTTFYGLKPQRHRSRRWDFIGTAIKFIAGTPDAEDLRIVNSTMNELIDQNNAQLKVNMQLSERISRLTSTINGIVENSLANKIILDEVETITTILNIDNINQLLDNIQDAVTLSKSSLVSNKILSLRELNTIRTLLQDQGIAVDYPDEALQFVIPKLALKDDILLYMLNVPQLENTTSNILRIYPLVNNNRILHQYPTHVVKRSNNLYTTSKPEDFVQKSSFLNNLYDKCLNSLINGKQAECVSSEQNNTIQKLITENSILISNAKNQVLQSNCGPDNRTLYGNFLISFANCTIVFNNQYFSNNELTSEADVIQRAFHNLKINWKWHKNYELEKINNETVINRIKLDHVYLKQNNFNFKLWSLFGGFSLVQITCILTISFILFYKFSYTIRNLRPSDVGPRRSSLKGGAVIDGPTSNMEPPDQRLFNQIESVQKQQQQLAVALSAIAKSTETPTDP